MGNLFAYIQWRGDLTLSASPFGEVDSLILSMLSYFDFGPVVPPPGQGEITVERAAQRVFEESGPPEPPRTASNSQESLRWLLYLMAHARRYRRMKLSSRVDLFDAANAKQFYAICIHVSSRQLYLSFRGTTDDLAGWKEDFLLTCLPEIPSHREAVQYLTDVASRYPDKQLLLGGHSKGGNLAVYAASFAPCAVQQRIRAVWSNDGPGFQEALLASDGYRRIAHAVHSIVPKSSVVGMLLSHDERRKIVDSTQIGILQHDGFSWEISGDRFVELDALTSESLRVDQAVRSWLRQMDMDERRQAVECLFDVLYASGATTLSEIRRERLKTMTGSISRMKELPRESRERIIEFLVLLRRSTHRLNLESRLTLHKKALSDTVRRSRGHDGCATHSP